MTMTLKRTITSVLLLTVLLFSGTCFSQDKEYHPNWEISMSSGQSFVDYIEGFGTGFNTGLTFSPEVSCHFSRLFTASLSMYFTTAHSGNDKANLVRVFSVEPFEGVSIVNHYQTTLTPAIQFIPLHFKKHQVFIGIGPSYTFGNSLLSESIGEISTTLFKHVGDFGYLGSVGYQFSIGKNWGIGGRYIYNKGNEKTEHILFSLGYRIN